jgi:aspartyl-tRNA(Asn)/glutamyl-tRNA(Gln) amidotransferase subunit C
MSDIDIATARKIARLARLRESDEVLIKRAESMTTTLTWVEQLHEVNTDGVEPLSNVVDTPLMLRADVVNDGGDREKVLSNAPEETQGFFVVPKVVE